MVIDMNDEQLHTLAQIQALVEGTVALDFAVAAEERYGFIARTVRRFGYARLKRPDKAVVLRFLERVSGYSRQQIARLVKRGGERGQLIKRLSSFATLEPLGFRRNGASQGGNRHLGLTRSRYASGFLAEGSSREPQEIRDVTSLSYKCRGGDSEKAHVPPHPLPPRRSYGD